MEKKRLAGEGGADFLLDAQRQRRQIGVGLLDQEGIEASAMFDSAQGCSGNAQLDRAVQRLGDQRNVDEVGEETAAVTVEGVRNGVAHQDAFAGKFAATCHL